MGETLAREVFYKMDDDAKDCWQYLFANRVIQTDEFGSYLETLDSYPVEDPIRFEKSYAFTFFRSTSLFLCEDRSWVVMGGDRPFDYDGSLKSRSATFQVLAAGDRATLDFKKEPDDTSETLFAGRIRGTEQSFAVVRAMDFGARYWFAGPVTDGRIDTQYTGNDMYINGTESDQIPKLKD